MCSTFDSTPKMEKTETAILLVAQNGITETVKKILKRDSNGH